MGWTGGEDIFGDVDGLIREQRGWLTEEVNFYSCFLLLIQLSLWKEINMGCGYAPIYNNIALIVYDHFSGNGPAKSAG